jgi:hypothetical protein
LFLERFPFRPWDFEKTVGMNLVAEERILQAISFRRRHFFSGFFGPNAPGAARQGSAGSEGEKSSSHLRIDSRSRSSQNRLERIRSTACWIVLSAAGAGWARKKE